MEWNISLIGSAIIAPAGVISLIVMILMIDVRFAGIEIVTNFRPFLAAGEVALKTNQTTMVANEDSK
jgi:hypothetical protein